MKRLLSVFIVLTLLALSGCGGQGNSNVGDDSGKTAEAVSVDSLKTIGDAFALDVSENQYAVSEGKVVYAFKAGDTYYRVIASISDEDQQKYMDIGYDDPDYEAKQHEIIDPLEIEKTENLNEKILSEEELDALTGKTGKELTEEGWTYQGSYNLDGMEVWMCCGPFEYTVIFDGTTDKQNSDDFDIEEETKDMKVKSVKFNALGDATTLEEQ